MMIYETLHVQTAELAKRYQALMDDRSSGTVLRKAKEPLPF